jgi:hypothetical protein
MFNKDNIKIEVGQVWESASEQTMREVIAIIDNDIYCRKALDHSDVETFSCNMMLFHQLISGPGFVDPAPAPDTIEFELDYSNGFPETANPITGTISPPCFEWHGFNHNNATYTLAGFRFQGINGRLNDTWLTHSYDGHVTYATHIVFRKREV